MAIISVIDIQKYYWISHAHLLYIIYKLFICMFDFKLNLTCMIIRCDIITQKMEVILVMPYERGVNQNLDLLSHFLNSTPCSTNQNMSFVY